MKKLAAGLALVVALLVAGAIPSYARGGHGGGGFHGGGFHGGGSIRAGVHGGGFQGSGFRGGWHGGPVHAGWRGGWHGGWRGGVFIGEPWWWGPPFPYPYVYPYGYYGGPPYDYPPDVEAGPSVYVQQPPSTSETETLGYWYYCPSSKAYYPTVQGCRDEWIKVPPAPPQ